MSYPEKNAGYRHMPKFMDRALADERRANGGDVSVPDTSLKTTDRFLPKYDFDYDPTGGETTGQMTNFGESPEVSDVRGRMNKAMGSTMRGEPIEDPSAEYPYREDRHHKHGGRVRKGD